MENSANKLDPSTEGLTQPEPILTANGTAKEASCRFNREEGRGGCSLKDALSKTDTTILRLSDLISTSSGQETVLATVNYSAEILHYALSSSPLQAILVRLRTRLGLSNPRSPRDGSKSQIPPFLALASLISETRTAIRLLGLIPLWKWGSATMKSPPVDPILRVVAFAQVFVNVVYQFMENVAFLASKGIISQRALQRWGGIGQWYIWATRAWLSHVVLEFVRLWREQSLFAKQKQLSLENCPAKGIGEGQDPAEALRLRAWRKSLVSNLAWFPLCVHWSLEKGAGVPNSMTGLISFIAGAWKLSDSWEATARAS
ncbi:hypothetical protein PRK78_006644 [Emydomyces testavorans]|uniref:Peroxin 11C n=1 Tax=Emydomyces testavorans TaxID=2070801 RepID=A0AAF0INT0_9EURO|nr:hypothetical protein PRK78_006644 [Emydomyces testavorans]